MFCDLDGALADFERGVKDATGRAPEDQPVAKTWQRILSKPGFFRQLGWMADGAAIWAGVSQQVATSARLAILTGLPRTCKKAVQREKQERCAAHLSRPDVDVITTMSADKAAHSGPGCVLIDDRADARDKWEAAGGVFIHHVPGRADRALHELRRAFGELPLPNVGDLLGRPEHANAAAAVCGQHITVVENEWPAGLKGLRATVGFDSEHEEGGAGVAIVQLAVCSLAWYLEGTSPLAFLLARPRQGQTAQHENPNPTRDAQGSTPSP